MTQSFLLIFQPKNRAGRRPRKLVALAMCLSLMVFLLAACGEVTPTDKTTGLLINEVFTGQASDGVQWIELLNNSDTDLALEGYRLDTTRGTLDVSGLASANGRGLLPKGAIVVFSNAPKQVNDQIYQLLYEAAPTDADKANIRRPLLPISESKIIGKLDPNKDFVVLKGTDGKVVDQVGWGGVDQGVRASLGADSDINTNLPTPKYNDKSLGRTPQFGQRPANDPGQINPGPFTLHNTPTPGTNTTPRSLISRGFVLNELTNAIAAIGGALLWVAFFIIALVAKRFETLSEQKTYWQYLMAAPAGIFIYTVIQVQDFVRQGSLSDFWSWPAFLALFVSGVACVYVINIFRLIAKNILQSE